MKDVIAVRTDALIVLERKEFRERERTNREQIHRDTVVRS
jgi:hypothetical protein